MSLLDFFRPFVSRSALSVAYSRKFPAHIPAHIPGKVPETDQWEVIQFEWTEEQKMVKKIS